MSGGQGVGADRVTRVLHQRRELDLPVAQDVRVRGDARLVVPNHLTATTRRAAREAAGRARRLRYQAVFDIYLQVKYRTDG